MQPTAAELTAWRAHHARLTACLAGPGYDYRPGWSV
jgi:hypothetical protein